MNFTYGCLVESNDDDTTNNEDVEFILCEDL